MTNEGRFWSRIVEGLWSPTRMLLRIESGVSDGVPDAYVCAEGVSVWAELKCPSEPLRPTTALFSGAHKLSIAQRNWLLAHRQAGGRGFVAIETESCVMLIGARFADAVNKSSLVDLRDLADFYAPRPLQPHHWDGLLETLICFQPKGGGSP